MVTVFLLPSIALIHLQIMGAVPCLSAAFVVDLTEVI
jgi:hypothetical protein